MKRSFGVPALALAGLAVAVPASASADTYSVFSCRDATGAPNAALGWIGTQSGTGLTGSTCSSGGALSAVLPDARPPAASSATLSFPAPVGTKIVRITAARKTNGLTKSTQGFDTAYTLDTDNALLEKCAPAADSSCVGDLTEPVDKQGLSGAFARFRAQCTSPDSCSSPLRVDVSAVNVGLQDLTAPAVANARLVDSGDGSGVLTVAYDASDVGGGVYRTLVKVDGKPTQALNLAPAPCADNAPSNADPYEFNVPVPCPLGVQGATARVDVKSLPAGPHAVEIAVEDAAANQTNVFGPVEFPRLNTASGSSKNVADVLTARLRMWFVKARNRGTRYTSRFGRRVVTRGVLRDRRGRGIQGARVDVYHIRRGKRRLLKTGLKSRSKGALTLILPLNVDTRRVQFVYRAVRPGPPTSTQTLRLTVRDRRGRIFHRSTRRRSKATAAH